MKAKIGFIGTGVIGSAMLKSLLKVRDRDEIIFTDADRSKVEKLEQETGVCPAADNADCVRSAKIVVLAVKPQFYDAVLRDIKDVVTEENIIISIAPGISVESVRERLHSRVRIVRCMPNTPAMIGEGMTGVCYDARQFDEEEQADIAAFFNSFGRMELLPETLMNAVTCVSGSSPAYVYMFIEALADAGVKYGMPRNVAYRMAAQTVAGSAKMVLETGKHPGELKDNVCSPGGTTICAVASLEENGLRSALIKASDACYEKCVDMAAKK